jgi:hypothetical protein
MNPPIVFDGQPAIHFVAHAERQNAERDQQHANEGE